MKTTGKKTKLPKFDEDGYQVGIETLNGEPVPDAAHVRVKRLHGGARKGAGRKPVGNQPMLLRLSPNTAQRLRAKAKREGKTLSQVAEEKLASL